MDKTQLVEMALEARKKSYSPYSKFSVGAALLAKDGRVYTGCNIENASFSVTNCAERTAFFKAISDGNKEFEAIAIVGGECEKTPDKICAPCGVCRQVMMEFCDYDNFDIILGSTSGVIKTVKLKDILPLGFGPDSL
ncbi:MAG: cytidine deaminase [Lachnospiraceae bacterium]|nr:cytidine deaminase [Lachnospiraceae bacterium]MEE1009844.1 cytidine deaminase [Agathobacter sp.]